MGPQGLPPAQQRDLAIAEAAGSVKALADYGLRVLELKFGEALSVRSRDGLG